MPITTVGDYYTCPNCGMTVWWYQVHICPARQIYLPTTPITTITNTDTTDWEKILLRQENETLRRERDDARMWARRMRAERDKLRAKK